MTIKVLAISSYKDTWNSVRPECEMLISLAEAGAQVTVMAEADCEYAVRFREAGLRLVDFHARRKFSWKTIRAIRDEIMSGGHDVVYCFNNKAIGNAVWAVSGSRVKLVTYRGQTGNISRWDPACYLTHLHPRVDGIICVANTVRDDLLRHSRLGPERIVTIYKGHEREWYQDVRPADLTALGIPENAPVVICVANARPRKGIPILLDAWRRLVPGDWRLLLVGSGMDDLNIRGMVAGRIHAVGFRKDVLSLVAASRIGVLPTIKREGLPKTVIEAMALGLPVVVTDSGGSRELVVEGKTGYVVPARNPGALSSALAGLMADEGRCREMGAAACNHLFDNFTSCRAGEQTLAYFLSICERR